MLNSAHSSLLGTFPKITTSPASLKKTHHSTTALLQRKGKMASSLALKKTSNSTVTMPLLTKLLLRRPTKAPVSSVTRFTTTTSRCCSARSSAAVIIETDMDKEDYKTLESVDESGVTTESSGYRGEAEAAVKAGRAHSMLITIRQFGIVKLVKRATYELDKSDPTNMIIKMTTVFKANDP